MFAYGDVLHRAMRYKEAVVAAGEDREVTVDFAIYKLAQDGVYTSREDPHGRRAQQGCADNGATLLRKLVDAANAGVRARLLYQNPEELKDGQSGDAVGDYLRACPPDGPWNGGGSSSDDAGRTLRVHRANWRDGTYAGQMHNTFLLASHMLADGRVATNATLVATANVHHPQERNWTESAVLVVDEPGLFAAYRNYFQVLWDHTLAPEDVEGEEDCGAGSCLSEEFRERMRSDERPRNYVSDDGKVQAFFYPLPGYEIWDVAHNAVAKHVHAMKHDNPRRRYMKFDMYHLRGGYFVRRLVDDIKDMDVHLRGYYQKDSRHDSSSSSFLNFQDVHDGDWSVRFGNEQVGYSDNQNATYRLPDCARATHSKNYLFSYPNATDERRYVTITGSTNGMDDAYNSKANNQLVVVEEELPSGELPPIYLSHKNLFYGTFNHCLGPPSPVGNYEGGT